MRVKLSDVTKYLKGTQINGEDLIENGKYIYLNGGINPSGRWNDANVKGNTVTISEGGNSSGYVNYVTEPFWCGAHCYYLFDGPKNTRYLYYALKSQQERLFGIRSGACMPNIKKADLGRFEFEFDTDEQKQSKVVSLLSKIEVVIGERKRELELLEQLIKSRFVEMFGDIKYGLERWGGKSFKDITINLDSRRKPVKDADRKKMQGIYPYYGATGIVDYVNDYRQEGDFLLVSEDGKALELRSKPIAFLASGKIWVNNHAHVQQCTNECNMIYLMYHINFMDISTWITGIDQKKLNRANLDTIPIALPPIELQEQFANFVNQINKSKLLVQKSLEETQQLFDALMQKYFS